LKVYVAFKIDDESIKHGSIIPDKLYFLKKSSYTVDQFYLYSKVLKIQELLLLRSIL